MLWRYIQLCDGKLSSTCDIYYLYSVLAITPLSVRKYLQWSIQVIPYQEYGIKIALLNFVIVWIRMKEVLRRCKRLTCNVARQKIRIPIILWLKKALGCLELVASDKPIPQAAVPIEYPASWIGTWTRNHLFCSKGGVLRYLAAIAPIGKRKPHPATLSMPWICSQTKSFSCQSEHSSRKTNFTF